MMRDRGFHPLLAALLLVSTGCGLKSAVSGTGGLPQEWQGRRLYNTRGAYIYAGSDAAAHEADRIVRAAARELEQRGGTPAKGLVIMSGPRSEPITPDLAAVADWAEHGARAAQESGVPAERAILRDDLAIEPGDLPALGLPAADVSWAAALPTRSLIRRSTSRMWGANFESTELEFGQRLVLAWYFAVMALPLMPLDEAYAIARDDRVFRQLATAQPHWTEEQRSREAEAYAHRLKYRRMGIFADPQWWP